MKNKVISEGDTLKIKFSLKDEEGRIIFGEPDGKVEIITLDSKKETYDIFKCLIGKSTNFEGRVKVNKNPTLGSKKEKLSTVSLPDSIIFEKNSIIRTGVKEERYAFVLEVNSDHLILETEKPFRRITSILEIKVLAVQGV